MKIFLILLCAFSFFKASAQTIEADSVKKLNEIIVKGYFNPQSLLRSVAAVSLIDSDLIKNQSNNSLVSLANTVSGIRMEERSPGSYRFSMRGSLLRSPFGVRNIKIYLNDFPLTDAGGNTYLNLLDPVSISSIEIYKGPEASTFGANTGGTVLINSFDQTSNQVGLSLKAGSYGLLHQTININQKFKNYSFNLTQGFQQSEGYRENSALKRNFIQTSHQWQYHENLQLKAFVFYSKLSYETPGGLTVAQLQQNPQMARPATATLPSASHQKAAIYNQTTFGGLANQWQINSKLKHLIAVFGSYTDFKNPFITNYEKRYESTIGLRTLFDFSEHFKNLSWNAQIGLERASTASEINNYNNNAGTATSLQNKDDLDAGQTFAFARVNFDFKHRLLIEIASSLNFYRYTYQSYFPLAISQKEKIFNPQLMPKLAISYLVHTAVTLRASVSKGYSPPTLAEVRSSDNLVNNDLQAEYGWNYEFGTRFNSLSNRFYANLNLFDFRLRDAIVRRLNQNDIEYFINAGGTKQQGIEFETSFWIIPNRKTQFVSGLQFRNSYTYSRFRFIDFIAGNANYTGNKLTGVPEHSVVSSLEFLFKKGIFLFAQHQHTTAIPLNDANTVKAMRFNLVDLKTGIRNLRVGKTKLEIFAGINNLLNVNYSLGNDLNAANGRYFNPAAKINFYSGLSARL